MKRKILSMLLCIAVCMTMMPAMGYAAESTGWKIGNQKVEGSGNITGTGINGTVTYDATSNTLTLDNAEISISGDWAITCGGQNPIIVVKGTNTVTSQDTRGIYSNAALTIEGVGEDAKLTVKSNEASKNSEGICCRADLMIRNMELEAESNSTNGNGIYCEWKLTIERSRVTAKAERATSANFGAINARLGIVAERTSVAPEGFISGTTQITGKSATFDNKTAIYDLWVGGVQVTSKNATNITGTGITLGNDGKISYDATSNTLTLNNATITGSHTDGSIATAIRAMGNEKNITIKLKGVNSISNLTTGTAGEMAAHGIFSYSGSITIINGNEDGTSPSLTIHSNNDAIHSGDTTALSNVTVTATGTKGDGIYSDYNITIKNANVVAKGVNGIRSGYDITAEPNSTVKAEGTTGYGIVANNNISLQNSDIKAKCNSGDAIVSRYGEITCTAEMSPIKNGTNVYAEDGFAHIIRAIKANDWVSLKRTTNSLYYNTEDGQVYTSYNEKTNTFSNKWDRGGITGKYNTLTGKYNDLTLTNLYFVTTADKALVIPGMEKTDTITINCEGENIICAGYNGNVEDYGIKTDANLIIKGGTLSMAYAKMYSSINAGGDIKLVDTDVTVCRFITGGKLTLENAILHAWGYPNQYSIDTKEGIYYYDNLYAAKGDDIACEKLSDSNIISKLGKASLTLFSETFAYFDANGGKWEDGKGSAIIRSESKQEGKRWITIPDAPTRNGYNFIGWFTEKDGGTQITENKIEYKESTDKSTALVQGHNFSGYAEVPANTYYAHWTYSGGGSGGGGAVIPAPTTPDSDVVTVKDDKTGASEEGKTTTTKTTINETKTETTKNEQGQTVSKTTAAVSKETADKLVDQAVSNKSDTVEITVKSGAASGNTGNEGAASGASSTEVEIPKSAVESIAKNTDADLVIKTDEGQLVLDNKTLATIASESKGDTIKIVVDKNTSLKEAQNPAKDVLGKNGHLFELKAYIGSKLVHNFKGGKAHVTLPMPEKLKGKDVVVVYINDKGLCEILNHTMETVGADSYIRFTTTHFSTFAVVEKAAAQKYVAKQNKEQAKALIKDAKFKAATAKTSKKNIKVTITAKTNKTIIKDLKAMGYTVKYQFYRSTKKASGYKAIKTKGANTFTNTGGTKGTKYYYKARVLVYDGNTLLAKSALKQCSYGTRTWNK